MSESITEPWYQFHMPARVETARLLLRPYEPADAPTLKAAIDENLEHLLPWIPWAQYEPSTLEQIEQRIAGFAVDFRDGPNWGFAIFRRDDGRLLGGIGFHARIGPRALEIGYWLDRTTTGHGYATEAVESLTRVAFDFPEVERLEIRVDPRNAPSAAIPRRLGYLHVATLEKNFTALPGPPRDTMVWEMTRDRFHSLTLDERLR